MRSGRGLRPRTTAASGDLTGGETTAWLSLLQLAQVAHAAFSGRVPSAEDMAADPMNPDGRPEGSSLRSPASWRTDTPQQDLVGRAFKHVDAVLRSQAAAILDGLSKGLAEAECGRSVSVIAEPANLGGGRAADAARWKGLLVRLCRSVIDVLDGRVRAEADLPIYALHILRRLWWTGPQSLSELVQALQADREIAAVSLRTLARREVIESVEAADSGGAAVFELTTSGMAALRQAIARQRELVRRAVAGLPPGLRGPAVRLLTQLAVGLAREARGLVSGCPDCWAGDQRACVRAGHYDHCPIRQPAEETWAPVWEEASLRLLADTEEAAAGFEPSSRANLEMV